MTYVRYPATATLSVDAPHVSETLVLVAPETPRFGGCDGGVVSADVVDDGEQAVVEALSCADGEELPAASRATTANVYEVPQERPLWPALVVVTDVILVPVR